MVKSDLIQDPVVAVDHERDPGELGFFSLTHGETVDVKRAGSEHAGNMGQHARLVHHQCRQNVSHGR